MKKTSKSPENVKVTPNKKKLKQARLPFMLLSDVSPKAEIPPSRKRKLSVPDAVPATKIGKLSKENSVSEELVVISDEESRGLSSPKKQDKCPNPYVKLVDTARKKKLLKTKVQKKSKKKPTSKKSSEACEIQTLNDNIEDVEMMEAEALVHQDSDNNTEKSENSISNGDIQIERDDKDMKIKETNNNSKGKEQQQQPIKPETSSKKVLSKSKQAKRNSKILNENETIKVVVDTICLSDSNNSSDVKMPETTNKDKEIVEGQDKEHDPKEASKKSNKSGNRKKSTPKKRNQVLTPKRSLRVQPKNAESENDKKEVAVESEASKEPLKEQQESNSVPVIKDKNDKDPTEKKDDSDIEMIEPEEDETESTNEKSQESPSTSDNEDTKSKSEGLVTPKRASRSKTKQTDSNLDKSTCSLLDESMTSNPTTPKQADKSLNESLKNLTPKQMAIRLEATKRREAREKEKQERDIKRQQEKEEKAKQRQEKEDQKKREREEKEEAKRKEKEEKEEQKKKEREEKEKQRDLEKKIREEKEEAKRKEKEEKEEQKKKEKEAREEERRKKQEALELEKQEQELKLKKTKEAFVSFFVPKHKVEKDSTPSEKAPVSKSSMLSSFTVKVDMRLAPTCRVELDVERKDALEKAMQEQKESASYLKYLKNGENKPGSCGKTWPLDEKDDDVMIIEEDLPPIDGAGEVITCESAPREPLRPKLLSFHANRRPPYWGTWRKKSRLVKPRRPFGQEKQLDYEVDSDDDWEDDADGESLDGSAGGSDDEAGNDDYEVDNEVFVPHGYLSDEEATMDEEDDDVLSLSPETQKARLKHLEDEFESELRKPTEKLKPRLYGLLWETSDGKKPEKCVDALWNYFEKFSMIMGDVTPLLQPAPEAEKDPEKKKIKKKKQPVEEGSEQSPKSKKKKEIENKDKKPKPEVKKVVPNQPGINTFLKKVNTT